MLVEPIPEAGWNVPELIAKRMHFAGSDDQSLSTDYSVYIARTKPVIAAFEAVQQQSQNVRIAPIHTRFCDVAMGRCANANSTDVWYLDGDHPSDAGAALIAPGIVQAVASLPAK